MQSFKKYKEIAGKVLEVILDLYADVGYRELENPKNLLQLPQIKKIGSPVEIVKEFGGVKEYQTAVDSLSQIIYERWDYEFTDWWNYQVLSWHNAKGQGNEHRCPTYPTTSLDAVFEVLWWFWKKDKLLMATDKQSIENILTKQQTGNNSKQQIKYNNKTINNME